MSIWANRVADELSNIFGEDVVPLDNRGDTFRAADADHITEQMVQHLIDQGDLECWQDDTAPDCNLGDGQLYVIIVVDEVELFLSIDSTERGVYFYLT